MVDSTKWLGNPQVCNVIIRCRISVTANKSNLIEPIHVRNQQ